MVDVALARISDPLGEGQRVFTKVYADAARRVADHADVLAGLGIESPPLAGLPVSIKDLFDVKGEATTAGSRLLSEAPPALQDAEVVRRLRRAGAAIIGKTNMTEFAFSGLGLNPHYGTPLNAWDRKAKRIPGGSSSGAAISVTDGMAVAAVGTDTGGSCRIPAALNGIVGMKPTACSVPLTGVLPLSASYDSVGPLAASVDTCALLYGVLSGTASDARPVGPRGLSLAVVKNYVLEQLDGVVARTYEAALRRLAAAGVQIQEISIPVLNDLPMLFEGGGVVAAQAYSWHRNLLMANEAAYDPRVSIRIKRGEAMPAHAYVEIQHHRRRFVHGWSQQIRAFDAVVMPTVPLVAPRMVELADDGEYGRVNLLMLRNPTVINALDGCAISLPCHEKGAAPVGLMVACRHGRDWDLLEIARALEEVLARE